MLTNYGDDRHRGLAISTAFIESLVHLLLAKRFQDKKQRQWTRQGAHLLLAVRCKVLNHELADTFRSWYPNFQLQAA